MNERLTWQWRYILRALWRRRWLSVLTVVGIALGVAVVVAVDLANASAARAFTLSTESITGRATHHIVGGPGGVDERLYTRLRTELGERLIAPVVEGYVRVDELGETPLRLLGVDPFAEAPFRPYLATSPNLPPDLLVPFLRGDPVVVLARDVAVQAGIAPGERLHLRYGTRGMAVQVAGLLEPADAFTRRALDGIVLADISMAQQVLGMEGRLSRIDLLAPDDDPTSAARLERIRALLPPDVTLTTAARQAQSVRQLSAAFELNLTALSLLALVVGMFLIYNTMTFSVVQRRPVLGTLRALGITREGLFGLIAGEALVLGAIGSVLGVLFGILLARELVRLVTQTINDLYFVVSVRDVAIPPLVLLKGLALGMAATLLATLFPAYEAATPPPAGTMRRSSLERRTRHIAPCLAAVGGLLFVLSWGMLQWPSRALPPAFAGVFGVVLGFAAFTPTTILLMARLGSPLLGQILGPVGRMAPRTIANALSRTGLAIAALMVAVSVSIGVALMVDAFRLTVERWLDSTLRADVYVSAPALAGNRADAPLDPTLGERIATVEGVAVVEAARNVLIDSPDMGPLLLVAVEWKRPRDPALFICRNGTLDDVATAVRAGAVIVSEPFAYRHGVSCGDTLTLRTRQGEEHVPIVGVFYDYSADQGVVLMDLQTYRIRWNDPWVSSYSIYTSPDADVSTVADGIRAVLAGENVLVRTNRTLREAALAVFDRTFAITRALQLLAVVVAFIGVLSALMALQIERTRELATLRAIGLTPRQLWQLTVLETSLMGALAGVLSWPTGITLAAILVFIINKRSFGWTIQFALSPSALWQALVVAIVAAIVAGLFPAWRLTRLHVAAAIRNE
nr:ABC transporter permease [Ardenticatena sp.]